jgi:hypothetical protein
MSAGTKSSMHLSGHLCLSSNISKDESKATAAEHTFGALPALA